MIHLISAKAAAQQFKVQKLLRSVQGSMRQGAVQSSKFKAQGYMLLEVLLICSCSDFFSRKSFSMRVLCSLALMPVLPNV